MEGEIKKRKEQLTMIAQELARQINEHKQNAQVNAVGCYLDEQQLGQALIDCMQWRDNQLRKKLVPRQTMTSTPVIQPPTSMPASALTTTRNYAMSDSPPTPVRPSMRPSNLSYLPPLRERMP